MNNFQISPEVDRNKVFLINRSELAGRIDANTHHPERRDAIAQIKRSTFRVEKLGFITSFSKNIVTTIVVTDIYVGLENIESNTGIFIDSNRKESICSALSFKTGQVLFPKLRPYLNKVFYANFDGICSTEFHILDGEKIDNRYLFYFLGLDIIVKQTSLLMSGNTLPRLQTEDIKNLLIPIPPKETQLTIVAKMDAAYANKKQKETEAQRLLDSIDDYLLGELGIELPAREENTLQSRMFTRRLSEVSGGRFDPDYFQEYYREIQQSLHNGQFSCKAIKNVADLVINGNTPASNDYSDKETNYPIIKVKSYQGDFISLEKLDFTKEKKIKRAKKHDIFLLSAAHQASYVGRFMKYLDREPLENSSFVGELICIRANKSTCNPMYLFSLLNSEPYKILLNREKTGQTSHIYPTDIKHIKIPIPPLEKQTEIANHITKIRNQAKQLQQQAKTELDQAKKEVEAMILGDGESKV